MSERRSRQLLADYRHEEVFYDTIKTGSPFSVLRSPFSVLRSPFSVSSLLIVLLGFAACASPAGSDEEGYGSLTVTNLPGEYGLRTYHINSDLAVQWEPHQFGMVYPETDAYYSGIIGSGFSSVESPNYTANKGPVFGNTWSKKENGTWGQTSSNAEPFTFSGKASVWVMYVPFGNNNIRLMGYNNVQFSGGHAVIDYNASSFTIPQTNGKFTLTDIPSEHHNKYAILVGSFGTPPNITALYGLKDATSATAFKGYPITGSTAEIPVFKLDTVTMQFSSFDEAPSVLSLVIIIQDEEEFDFLEYTEAMKGWDGTLQNYPLPCLVYTGSGIQFSGGKGKASFSDIDWGKAGGL